MLHDNDNLLKVEARIRKKEVLNNFEDIMAVGPIRLV